MNTMSYLDDLTKESIEYGILPLQQLLQNSFFYPACGFDGGVVEDCNTRRQELNIRSFIYCDYATGEEAFINEQNTFFGYHILGSRSVSPNELSPTGWEAFYNQDLNCGKYREFWKPFIKWSIYKRDESKNEKHGPKVFSILYIGGEGVSTYKALYWANKTSAKAMAIIQPGTGYGLNWTDFRDERRELGQVVNLNPSGKPEIVYYGGQGNNYNDFNWLGYVKEVTIKYYYGATGEVTIWKNKIEI